MVPARAIIDGLEDNRGRVAAFGIARASGLKSWSAALTVKRDRPPRENGPMTTVALVSIEIRRMVGSPLACSCCRASSSKIASVSAIFLRNGATHSFRRMRNPSEWPEGRLQAAP